MKVLVVLSRVPYPLDKGDKLRAYYQIKEIAKKHEVILVCLSDERLSEESVAHVKSLVSELHIISLPKWRIATNLLLGIFDARPFQVHYFYHAFAAEQINSLIEQHLPRHIYCQLIRTAEYVKPFRVIPSTLDYMDAFSKGIERRITGAKTLLKPLFKTEYKRLKAYESECFKYFTNKTIISEEDRSLIETPNADDIYIVPNGVDFGRFAPDATAEKEVDVLFTGNMAYPPNVSASIRLARDIMPFVWDEFPNAKLSLAGATPAQAVLDLRNERIKVTGWVDDMRTEYNRARIFVAPMEIGTGLQNKLLEAMSMGLPCITSSLANQALQGENEKDLFVEDDNRKIAGIIVRLLKNSNERKVIGEAGKMYIHSKFSWNLNTKKLIELIDLS